MISQYGIIESANKRQIIKRFILKIDIPNIKPTGVKLINRIENRAKPLEAVINLLDENRFLRFKNIEFEYFKL